MENEEEGSLKRYSVFLFVNQKLPMKGYTCSWMPGFSIFIKKTLQGNSPYVDGNKSVIDHQMSRMIYRVFPLGHMSWFNGRAWPA